MLLDIKLSFHIPGLRKYEFPDLPGSLTHSRADHLIRKENISKSVWGCGEQEGQRLSLLQRDPGGTTQRQSCPDNEGSCSSKWKGRGNWAVTNLWWFVGELVDVICTSLLTQKLSLVGFCAAFNEDFKKPQIILHWISGIQQYFCYSFDFVYCWPFLIMWFSTYFIPCPTLPSPANDAGNRDQYIFMPNSKIPFINACLTDGYSRSKNAEDPD